MPQLFPHKPTLASGPVLHQPIRIIALGLACAALWSAQALQAQSFSPPSRGFSAADAQRSGGQMSPATAPAPELRGDAPDRHIVVPGDTLWAISGRFLKDPWRWGELWNMNKEQIRNPHRIYPGDVVVINRRAAPGQPMAHLIQAERVVRLSPEVRIESIGPKAIPAIPPQRIEPFLVRPFIIEPDQLDAAGTIVETQENRVVIGAGNLAYVRGLDEKSERNLQVFRPGATLIDPDTKETLGREAFFLGEVRVTRFAEISTVEITRSTQEIQIGDRLLPIPPTGFPEFIPRPPTEKVAGRIIGVYGRPNVTEVAQYDVVTLNRGAKDGLEVGHVLAMYRNPLANRSNNRPATLFGRTGPTGSEDPWNIQKYQRDDLSLDNLRGDVVWGRVGPAGSDRPRGSKGDAQSNAQRRLDPQSVAEERYGVLMVFRTFDRVSYGIIMDTSRPVAVSDTVRNP